MATQHNMLGEPPPGYPIRRFLPPDLHLLVYSQPWSDPNFFPQLVDEFWCGFKAIAINKVYR